MSIKLSVLATGSYQCGCQAIYGNLWHTIVQIARDSGHRSENRSCHYEYYGKYALVDVE
jgi:hypothetical protein